MPPAQHSCVTLSTSVWKFASPTCAFASGARTWPKLVTEGREDSQRYSNLLVNSQVVPSYQDAAIPAVKRYRELMDRYDPQPPSHLPQEDYTPLA